MYINTLQTELTEQDWSHRIPQLPAGTPFLDALSETSDSDETDEEEETDDEESDDDEGNVDDNNNKNIYT